MKIFEDLVSSVKISSLKDRPIWFSDTRPFERSFFAFPLFVLGMIESCSLGRESLMLPDRGCLLDMIERLALLCWWTICDVEDPPSRVGRPTVGRSTADIKAYFQTFYFLISLFLGISINNSLVKYFCKGPFSDIIFNLLVFLNINFLSLYLISVCWRLFKFNSSSSFFLVSKKYIEREHHYIWCPEESYHHKLYIQPERHQ